RLARSLHRPVLVHCVTEKGRGYHPAETHEADRMHSISPGAGSGPVPGAGPAAGPGSGSGPGSGPGAGRSAGRSAGPTPGPAAGSNGVPGSGPRSGLDAVPAPGPGTGSGPGTGRPAWTDVFEAELARIGRRRPDVVAVTAAMPHPAGLTAFA